MVDVNRRLHSLTPVRRGFECNGDFSPTTEGGAASMHRAIRSVASRVACRSYGCTMNTLLLVSVPFVVVTVIGPVVAASGTVARM